MQFLATCTIMAEGDDQKSSDETNPCPDDPDEPITLDLGIDPAKNYEKIDNDEECAGAASLPVSNEAPRREENPFSFKHFLRGDTTYQSQGARPKVYCAGRQIASVSDLELNSTTSSSSLENKSTRIVSDLGSGLPDFVQDHLVIEQSYLAQATTSTSPNTSPTHLNSSNILPDVRDQHHPIIPGLGGGNLPDFTRDSSRPRVITTNNASEEDTTLQQRNGSPLQGIARPQPEFPLDLPLHPVQALGSNIAERDLNEADQHNTGVLSNSNPLLLPDFLTDASRLTQQQPLINTTNSPETSPTLHLRHNGHHNSPPPLDLHQVATAASVGGISKLFDGADDGLVGMVEAYRRQVSEQSRRITALNGEVGVARQREQEWVLQRGQLEDSLEMSNIRAASAESSILQLKQEIKTLSTQVTVLLRENSSLRGGEGASCSNTSTRVSSSVEAQVQHFAQELRGAASTAERNLRQLLSGIDNLRMMASYMESSFGVEERPYQSNREDKDNTGTEFK